RPNMKFASGLACVVALGMVAGCGGEEGSAELQKQEVAGQELSSSCAGVMPPAAPSSWSHRYSLPDFAECGVNTSDASGNVILETTQLSPVPGSLLHNWDIFTSVGHVR